MQWNPFQFSPVDSGFAGGPLFVPSSLEKTGFCGCRAFYDAHQERDPHRFAHLTRQLRQSCVSDWKFAPSRGSCLLPCRFSPTVACFLALAERRNPCASYGYATRGKLIFSGTSGGGRIL